MSSPKFEYNEAFSRNTGWVTPEEQQVLRHKRIAIAGLGGVGGNHLITLTRLGIGTFNISDFDTYDLANFNRQIGASIKTINKPKLDVLKQHAKAINPELEINSYSEGINEANVDKFLDNIDLYVDSLDFFAIKARRMLFNKCAEKQIPAITAAPLGMGCSFIAFMPEQLTFEEYFQLEGHTEKEQLIRFLVGLAPRALQNKYLIYPQAVDIPNHKGPSTPMAIELCAGIAGSEALKILLNRRATAAAPWSMQFDAYRNKLSKTYRPGGNNNPLQKLALIIGRRKFNTSVINKNDKTEDAYSPKTIIENILDIARWAPSGDNSQPWRFEVLSKTEFIVHGFSAQNDAYDLQGHASQVSIGALLESIKIAASSFKYKATFTSTNNFIHGEYKITTSLIKDEQINTDPLVNYIKTRSVQRRTMKTTPLTKREKSILQDVLPAGYKVIWFEPLAEKWKITKILWANAGLRLTLPEAFRTHKDCIEWNCDSSKKHIPDKSLGIDLVTRKIMKWAMKNWGRVSFMNKYFGGTLLPRIQMDFIPSLKCSAHFVLMAEKSYFKRIDYIATGRAMQRFWLTATELGLQLQPAYTPIVFNEYTQNKVQFTESKKHIELANSVSEELAYLTKENNSNHLVFMGRIGRGKPVSARSTRIPLTHLLLKTEDTSSK